MFKKKMDQLLEQEMDRKDFLKHVGIAVVALSGATAVLKALSAPTQKTGKAPTALSYGGAPYGGKKA